LGESRTVRECRIAQERGWPRDRRPGPPGTRPRRSIETSQDRLAVSSITLRVRGRPPTSRVRGGAARRILVRVACSGHAQQGLGTGPGAMGTLRGAGAGLATGAATLQQMYEAGARTHFLQR
jgi:hypothetical protein